MLTTTLLLVNTSLVTYLNYLETNPYSPEHGGPNQLVQMEYYGGIISFIFVAVTSLAGMIFRLKYLRTCKITGRSKNTCRGNANNTPNKDIYSNEAYSQLTNKPYRVDHATASNKPYTSKGKTRIRVADRITRRLLLLILWSFPGLLTGIKLSVPAFLTSGGWTFPLSGGLVGSTLGFIFGDTRTGWNLGVFLGLLAWVCGFSVNTAIVFAYKHSINLQQAEMDISGVVLLSLIALGTVLGISMGAATFCGLWFLISHLYGRIQYRSDILHIVSLVGSVFGLLLGIVASHVSISKLRSR